MRTNQTIRILSEVNSTKVAGTLTKTGDGRYLANSTHFGPDGGISFKAKAAASRWVIAVDAKALKASA